MNIPRACAAVLIAAFICSPCLLLADDDMYTTKPKSQQDILKEREQACRGLKGEARTECLANYVGPTREKSSGAWKKPPNPPRAQGRE
jgi:hypothetical protein